MKSGVRAIPLGVGSVLLESRERLDLADSDSCLTPLLGYL